MDTMTKPIGDMTTTDITSTDMKSLGNGGVGAIKENVEAILASSRIWTSGCHAIGQTMAASAHAQFERNLSTWKAMASVTSINEAMELHAHLGRSFVEHGVAETGKLTKASMELAEQAIAPIKARMALATTKFSPPTLQR